MKQTPTSMEDRTSYAKRIKQIGHFCIYDVYEPGKNLNGNSRHCKIRITQCIHLGMRDLHSYRYRKNDPASRQAAWEKAQGFAERAERIRLEGGKI